jgi:hypothetical protein
LDPGCRCRCIGISRLTRLFARAGPLILCWTSRWCAEVNRLAGSGREICLAACIQAVCENDARWLIGVNLEVGGGGERGIRDLPVLYACTEGLGWAGVLLI